jgi:hypothetical protein
MCKKSSVLFAFIDYTNYSPRPAEEGLSRNVLVLEGYLQVFLIFQDPPDKIIDMILKLKGCFQQSSIVWHCILKGSTKNKIILALF